MSEFKKEKLPTLFDGIKGMVNPSVKSEDELRLSRHCRLMYERLLKGKTTNIELQQLTSTLAPSARRSDLRAELREHNRDLIKLPSQDLPAGVNWYAIVDADGKVLAA